MKIVFPVRSVYDSSRCATAFPAVVDGVERRILIADTALQDHFGARELDNFPAVLERNRPAIEDVARRMLEAGATGEVIISTGILERR